MLLSYHHPQLTEAGLDEAGRGCYAGPVFAAAVILPKHFYHPLLNDSKQLTEEQRYRLRPIIENEAISFAVAQVSHQEIDRINILQASLKAMHLAVEALSVVPELLLIDGNRFNAYPLIPHPVFYKRRRYLCRHCSSQHIGQNLPGRFAATIACTIPTLRLGSE